MKELLIIETDNSQQIKKILDEKKVSYRVYYENEEDYWRQAVRAASQDKQRNKEITAWDKISSKVKDK